jgi:Xaa-Pro dipeptidase
MFLNKQIDKLTNLMKAFNMDILVLGPSCDLEYITGLHPLVDERFKALFILADKRYFYIAPELYYEETREALGQNVDIIKWSDADGFITAILEAELKYELNGKTIGINDGIRAVDMIDISRHVNAVFLNGTSIVENIKLLKTHEEKECLRKAASIADKAAEEIAKYIHSGMTEKQIKDKLEELLFEYGGEEIAFETIVASGPNSSKPHYNGGSRVIEKNDVIVLDFGCRYKGYCSDISRMIFVGEPTEEQKKIYSIVVEANKRGKASAKGGVTAESVDLAARSVIKEAGYGNYFVNRTGHGIGTAVHEAPYIREGNKQILEDGMAFSIEPGIYIPGKYGMRVEDIVLINNGLGEVLNKASRDMVIVK